MDLAEIRIKLDEIDKQIENLFEERMRLCGEVAEFKIRTGKPVYDAEREQEKIEALTGMAEGDFNKQAVGELFLQMMTLEPALSVPDYGRADWPYRAGIPEGFGAGYGRQTCCISGTCRSLWACSRHSVFRKRRGHPSCPQI